MPRSAFGRAVSPVCFLLASQLFCGALDAQVRPRVTRRVDDGAVIRLPGTTHPAVGAAVLVGRAPANLPLERMLLQLKSSPEQTAALEELLAEQQDPASARYHAWLAPEEFGRQFGAAQEDIDAVTGWLQSQGFQVTEVSTGRRTIEFSGTANQVESAFHTQINRYELLGQRHTANAIDISIPEALALVVGGVASLHDFGAHPLYHARPTPLANFTSGAHGLGPYDFAAIYDLLPLWNAGYDGSGQSIAIVGETNIKLSDIAGFRSTFGLPANAPTVIVNGKDPGILPGDEMEADLDIEWAGAVARGAKIVYVASASTSSSDGVTLSAQYIVNHATAPVMSLSYGLCEAQMGSANQYYSSLWQQAAAEGIAVFVAAGDSGSAGCDAPSGSGSANTTKPASQGFGVNGLASTAYNVSVGGTQFNDTASPSTYWNAANDSHTASARGYIPEIVWNESSYAAGSSANNLYATGGGASTVWSRPSWQSAPGVPSGSFRLTPDVSLTAAGHDGYVVEQEGGLYLVGGTSASTPSFAGLMAIINQYTHTTNGNPNAKFYSLASQTPSVYHDITAGTNAVPCAGGSKNCSAGLPSSNVGTMAGYSAGTGYDLATGLGSVDAYALVTNWGGVPTAPSITALTPNPMATSAAAQTLTIKGAGFASGLKVSVGSTTFSGTQVTFTSSAQVSVNVNVGILAQTLAVRVTNLNGQASNSVSLNVVAPVVAPTIATMNPNPMTGSNSAQTLTVNGSGFLAGAKLTIGSTTITSFLSLTPTAIQVSIITGLTPAIYAVKVVNTNGGTSNSVNFTVVAPPAPVVSSLSPNPMTGSTAAQILTVNGGNFQPGTGLTVTVGTTTYTGIRVMWISASQLRVSVNVSPGAKTVAVKVTNPSGQASNSMNLTVK